MKRKWAMTIMTTAAILMQGTVALAQVQNGKMDDEMIIQQAINEEKNEYIMKSGEITEVSKEDDHYRILIGTPSEGIYLMVDDSELIINADTLEFLKVEKLEKGMKVTTILSKDAPMTMSLPPMCSGQVAIIVNEDHNLVTEGYFDESLTNETNSLALNIEKDTCIMSTTGERRIFTAEDVMNKNAAVIYTMTTRSIPAQTTPKMVLILPTGEKQQIEASNGNEKSAVAYVSVRSLAETYGYSIEWDNNTKTVVLVKDDAVFKMTVGKAGYTYNGIEEQLNNEIKLEGQKVSVPKEFVEILKGK